MLYVYAVTPTPVSLTGAPRGIDGTAIETVEIDQLAAVCSTLDSTRYTPASIEAKTGDVEWLGPRAAAHDAVVTWLSDQGTVVPMPMWALFTSDDAIREMLRARTPELTEMIERVRGAREYTLRVHAKRDELLAHINDLAPRLASLEQELATASPGQRYLRQRKLESERTSAVRDAARSVAQETLEKLSALAMDSRQSPVPAEQERGSAVLNASFLVRDSGLLAFRQTLTDLVQRYGGRGFSFEFTGPWAPAHFVGTLRSE
jgi:hypothetical protein